MSDLYAEDGLDSAPIGTRLEHLIEGDTAEETGFWVPQATTEAQRQAMTALQTSLIAFERAFGTEALGNQLNLTQQYLRWAWRRRQITARILEARADINAEAKELRDQGEEQRARTIQAQRTPDYPGRETDDRWMQEKCGYGIW